MTNKEAIKILKSMPDTSGEFSPIYPTPNNNDWQYLRGFYDAVNTMMNINSGHNDK